MEIDQSPIWITGANGLIGNYLVKSAAKYAAGERVMGLGRTDLDLTASEAVRQRFAKDKPKLIIHCAAISKSPVCQANPLHAKKINVDVTELLSELAADIPMFFFSTDLVFDGQTGGYTEHSPVNPLSIYGETKAAAEKIVLANPKHTVVRTSLNGGVSPTGDRGFNEELRTAWKERRAMKLFMDEFRSPIPAAATVRAVWELTQLNQPGLYHVAGSEKLSRLQMGQLIASRWPELKPDIQSGSLKDYKGAPRSPDTSLDSSKVQRLLSFPLPSLCDWLADNPNEVF